MRVKLPYVAILLICVVQGCATVGGYWKGAATSSRTLDQKMERMITDPDYWKVTTLKKGQQDIIINYCGPRRLRAFCYPAYQCAKYSDATAYIYILAGPLPNKKIYISQWGLGHELGYVLGFDMEALADGL